MYRNETERAWVEIDLQALEKNWKALQCVMGQGCKMTAVVKTDAYGHGAVAISRKLNQLGVDSFAVATIEEGIELRRAQIAGDILILGYTSSKRAADLKTYCLRQTIVDAAHAKEMEAAGIPLAVEIKIDTGMHRLGIDAKNIEEIEQIFQMKYLQVCGLYTHLCVADSRKEADILYTKCQIETFYRLLQRLKEKKIPIPRLHLQSSYGLLNYPEIPCDYARIGIALYGTLSEEGDTVNTDITLTPVLSVKARVTSVHTLQRGETAGYGRAFLAEKRTKLATVSVGYGDGIDRTLSEHHMEVLIQGKRVPVVGRICMDQMLVDVTKLEEVKAGELVTLVGTDGKEQILVTEVSKKAGTIANEFLSRLGKRMPRIYFAG